MDLLKYCQILGISSCRRLHLFYVPAFKHSDIQTVKRYKDKISIVFFLEHGLSWDKPAFLEQIKLWYWNTSNENFVNISRGIIVSHAIKLSLFLFELKSTAIMMMAHTKLFSIEEKTLPVIRVWCVKLWNIMSNHVEMSCKCFSFLKTIFIRNDTFLCSKIWYYSEVLKKCILSVCVKWIVVWKRVNMLFLPSMLVQEQK